SQLSNVRRTCGPQRMGHPRCGEGFRDNSLYIRIGLRYSQSVIRCIFVAERASNWQLAASKNSNSQLANSCKWQLAKGRNGNNEIRSRNKAKKRLRPVGHRSVELGFELCFQQK